MTVSTSFAGRFARRVRARRVSRLRLGLAALAMLALAAATGWVLLVSTLFGVRAVEVRGTDRLSAQDVIAAAGIADRTPLARVDIDAVARRVERLPAVSSATVLRRWPRTVQIVVHERVPAAVRRSDGGFVLVDREGVAFDQVRARPRRLPLVLAPTHEGGPALRAALGVLESVPGKVRRQVRSVHAASPEQVTLQLSRGRTVVWGSTERAERKATVLAVLLTRKAAVYDVSAPDTPTTRKHA